MMHLYGAIHPRAYVNHLYVQRDDGGRELMSILNTVQYEEQSMIEYIGNKDSEITTTIQHYSEIGRDSGRNKERDVRKNGRQRSCMDSM